MPVPATIAVFGTAAVDINFGRRNFPIPGKELAVKVFLRPGGKGIFQAIACRRLDAKTTLISAVGKDTFGESILEKLSREKVDARVESRQSLPQDGIDLSTDIVAVFPGEDDAAESRGGGLRT
jgi:ribokinase